MPRQARLVVPGGLYHVMARGIERRNIFAGVLDYREFIDRLEDALRKSGCVCFAWVLMPNHFHLLVQGGKEGTPPLMRRLMTGYAGYFNRRHRRYGHLFQNRYKAILCEGETYLLELIRYIHLNPLRGKIVESLGELQNYPWSGHRALLGMEPRAFQELGEVWAKFSKTREQAQIDYQRFVSDGMGAGRRADLTGGGLSRSKARFSVQAESVRNNHPHIADDRILGSGGFVEGILKEIEKKAAPHAINKISLEELTERVAKAYGLSREDLTRKGRRSPIPNAKAALVYLCTTYKSLTCQFMGDFTAITVQSASMAKSRGELIVRENPELNKLIN
jgi:putative transposase